jgi:hypothetical protein
MIEKNKDLPAFMKIDFDDVDVGDGFSFTKKELGKNGVKIILDEAKEYGLKIIPHEIDSRVDFYCTKKILPKKLETENDVFKQIKNLQSVGKDVWVGAINNHNDRHVRECLNSLERKNMIVSYSKNINGRGRPRKLYKVAR